MTENERQPVRAFTVDETAAGERLDKFLSTVCPDLTRSAAARVIEEGGVLLDGAPGNKKDKLRPGTRVELRSPDPSCNPYLAFAVCLAAGLDGIEKGMTPPAEITENIYAMDAAARKAHGIESLPGSLEEALRALEADQLILDTLGEHVAANYLTGKWREWDEYRTRVSSWEREKYIINY